MCYSLSIFDGKVVVFFFFKFRPKSVKGEGARAIPTPPLLLTFSHRSASHIGNLTRVLVDKFLHACDLHCTDYIVQRLHTFSQIGFFHRWHLVIARTSNIGNKT